MLKNLVKYEFKATSPLMGIFYLVLMVLAVVNRINLGLSFSGSSFFMGSFLMAALYIAAIVAVSVVTVVIIVYRFYHNLLGNEGYLMHTLPVTTGSHIWSKLITATVWSIASAAMVMISILLLTTWLFGTSDAYTYMNSIGGYYGQLDAHGGLTGALCLTAVLAMVSLVSLILKLYASLSLGQFSDNHRLLLSFGAFIGLGIAEDILTAIMSAIGSALGMFSSLKFDYSSVISFTNTNLSLFAAILWTLVVCAAYFLVTWLALDKKLNLR